MLNSLQPVKTLYRLDLDSVEFGNLQHSMRFGGQLRLSLQVSKFTNTTIQNIAFYVTSQNDSWLPWISVQFVSTNVETNDSRTAQQQTGNEKHLPWRAMLMWTNETEMSSTMIFFLPRYRWTVEAIQAYEAHSIHILNEKVHKSVQ